MSRFLVALLGALVLSVSVAPAQDPGQLSYGGSEFFRFFLHKKGLKPLSNFPEAWADPADTIIVCMGDADWINRDFQMGGRTLRAFVEAGGAVLIATDTKCESQDNWSWERSYGIRISGRLLMARADECFGGVDERPWVRPRRGLPVGNQIPADSAAAILAGIQANGDEAIATDRPSEMQVVPMFRFRYDMEHLAGYPLSAKGIADNIIVNRNWDNFAVAFRHQNSSGRLLVVADHSVFVNGLMKFTPPKEEGDELTFQTANIKFTNQTIDWLKGPDESRTKCLFVHDGQVINQFAKQVIPPPDMNPPIPPIPPDLLANLLLRMVNPMVGELQNRARPNNALDRWPGRTALRRWFIAAMTLLLALAIWNRLSRATRKEDRSRWVSLSMLGGLLAKGSTAKRKRGDLIDTGNVYEAARWRVRDRFDRLGGQPDADGHMPPILLADNSRQAVGLEASVRRLWQIGYGPKAVPVPIRLWDELNLELERAVRLAGKGIWCFAASVPVK